MQHLFAYTPGDEFKARQPKGKIRVDFFTSNEFLSRTEFKRKKFEKKKRCTIRFKFYNREENGTN